MEATQLRKIWNNNKLKLGYYPKENYTANTSVGHFTELKYNEKTLLTKVPKFNKKVYSILFENGEFTNACSIELFNETVIEATSSTASREITWHAIQEQMGFKWDDYVWALYFESATSFEAIYTGVIETITPVNDKIKITLNSRAANLKKITGNDTKTSYAGWNINARFGTCLDAILKDTDVVAEGDIDDIDYQQTENEGDADLKSSAGQYVGYYEENVVAVLREKQKYNFINDTSININFSNVLFHFIRNDGEHYYIYEDFNSIYNERVGQYTHLYLVKESDSSVIDLGYGRAPERDLETEGKINTIEGFNCVKTGLNVEYKYIDHIYSETTPSADFEVMAEVIKQDDYYIPLVSAKDIWYNTETAENNDFRWSSGSENYMYRNGTRVNENYSKYNISGEVNSTSADYYHSADYGVKNNNTRIDKSTKSRAYFVYDPLQDRLIFQRASNVYPAGESETIDTNYTKNWDNFGLNPLGYYSFQSETLGYSNISNNEFIKDLVFKNNTIYTITYSLANSYQHGGESLSYLKEIKNSGVIETINGFHAKEMYGINWFMCDGDEFLSYIIKDSSNNYKINYYENDSFTQHTIGSASSYTAPTSMDCINGEPVLLVFYNQKLTYYKPFDLVNNITYIAETLENALGGYIIKNQNDESFTAKIENNVVTYVSQNRIEILDLTDCNKLQSLLMLAKRANKFMYVDERDILQFKDAVVYDRVIIDKFINFEKVFYEGFKTLIIKNYSNRPENLFNPIQVGSNDYIGDIRGYWSGQDSSFNVKLKVTGANEITYSVTSSAERLRVPETVKSDIDWKDITIYIPDTGGSYFNLKFLDIGQYVENVPKIRSKFNMTFETKKLVELAAPLTETDSTNNLTKTKTIDNKLVDPSSALFLQEDINDFFLSNREMYKLEVLEPYSQFNMLQTVNINYPRENVNFVECYIVSMRINEKGTTEMILIQK